MKKARKKEIYEEAKRRLDLWLKHSTFDEMTVYGSLMSFNMALGLLGGYTFRPREPWMKKSDFQGFVTQKEFDSKDYDSIIMELFDYAESKAK